MLFLMFSGILLINKCHKL